MAKTAKNILPAYLTDIYGWLYLNPKLYNLLDNAFLLNFLTLGYHSLLTEEVKRKSLLIRISSKSEQHSADK